MPERALIVGASRGIGKGLASRHLVEGWEVLVTTRDGKPPEGLRPHQTLAYEVRSKEQLDSLVADLRIPVARVIHNAGILRAPRDELMAVNADAPIRTVESLLDNGLIDDGGVVAIMTSQMGARRGRSGSLGDYGDSKEALNIEFRRRSATWAERGVLAVVIHPGWVRTDMGGAGASISVEESVDGIMQVLDDLSPAEHGSFLTWDGRTHPW